MARDSVPAVFHEVRNDGSLAWIHTPGSIHNPAERSTDLYRILELECRASGALVAEANWQERRQEFRDPGHGYVPKR